MTDVQEYVSKYPKLRAMYDRALRFLPSLSAKEISVIAPATLAPNVLGTTIVQGDKCTVYFKHDPPSLDVFVHELIHCALPLEGVEGEEIAYNLVDLVMFFPKPFDLGKFYFFLKSKRALQMLQNVVLEQYGVDLGEFFRIQGNIVPCFERETLPEGMNPRFECTDEQKVMFAVIELIEGSKYFPQYRTLLERFVEKFTKEV